MDQKALIKHMEDCQDCRDEFENAFIVREGLKSIEEGRVFDFDSAVKKKLADSRYFCKTATRLKMLLCVLALVVTVALVSYWLGIFSL